MKYFKSRRGRGFTLVEIMVVLLIMSVVMLIGFPNYITARENTRAKSCQRQLQKIQTAKEQWALDTRAARTATPNISDLYGADKFIRNEPICPTEGNYTLGNLQTNPTCSVANNGTASYDLDDHIMPW